MFHPHYSCYGIGDRMKGLLERSQNDLTYMTTEMMRDIVKAQDEIVLNKLKAYCDDCGELTDLMKLYLEEPPLEVMNMYKKQGESVVFQVRQKCVKLICQSCREEQ